MTRRFDLANGLIVATIGLVLIACGVVQLGSDALYANAAPSYAMVRHVPIAVGLRIYRALDRIAPAPFVEATLGEHALGRGDLPGAMYYAIRLPASPERNDLLARIALARGEHRLAYEYFFAAPDIAAVQREIGVVALRDPALAYTLEMRFKDRLTSLRTHPDAVADAYWRMGDLATKEAYREPVGARGAALARGLHDYRTALALAPLNMKYVLASANQALALGELARAERIFTHGIEIDPASADATAGLGMVALRNGDRARALAFARRARAINPLASELLGLDRLLR